MAYRENLDSSYIGTESISKKAIVEDFLLFRKNLKEQIQLCSQKEKHKQTNKTKKNRSALNLKASTQRINTPSRN